MRPLGSTSDLVRAVERITGGARRGHLHPATRSFQALRIHVNDELASLQSFLDGSMAIVRSGGRVAVITFHSLEDRIVKNKFRASVAGRVLTKKVVTATQDEVRQNPRARSAKLRVWERA
jgi:16S rRNA (cytosine1402-N4)-methyltransferase